MVAFSNGNILDTLNAGNITHLSGELFTVRDQSLRKLIDLYDETGKIPFDIEGSIIFFAAPTPGFVEGRASIGPTTSWRMGNYVEFLLDHGVKGFIGKGFLPSGIPELIRRRKAVYFQALGGAGAYYGAKTDKIDPILFPELGPEAIFKLEVKDFPLIISIDTRGAIFS